MVAGYSYSCRGGFNCDCPGCTADRNEWYKPSVENPMVDTKITCRACDGEGYRYPSKDVVCSVCQGTRQVTAQRTVREVNDYLKKR